MIRTIKTIHTIVWVIMSSAILYIVYCGLANRFDYLLGFSIILIIFEGGVLLVSKGICPLTPIAMKYTKDRRDNFDIYLPQTIAKYNKVIFGFLYLFGLVLVIINFFFR